MRYDLIVPYVTEKYLNEVLESRKFLCDDFDSVNIPMDNYTWCEVYLDTNIFMVTSSSASRLHPGERYGFVFYENKVIVEKNTEFCSERLEIPYDVSEEELFQLSTVCNTEGIDDDVISTMNKIRDMYVLVPK